MAKDLGQTLKGERIQGLNIRPPLVVGPQATVQQAIDEMERIRIGCCVVEERGKLVGIFTERDVLTRVLDPAIGMETPIHKVMTPNPKCLKATDSIAEAVRLMNEGNYRHVPIVDRTGKVQGVLTVKGLVAYLAEHFPYEIYNLPPDPRQVQKAPEGA